jgi:hypothetical protein
VLVDPDLVARGRAGGAEFGAGNAGLNRTGFSYRSRSFRVFWQRSFVPQRDHRIYTGCAPGREVTEVLPNPVHIVSDVRRGVWVPVPHKDVKKYEARLLAFISCH